MSAGAQSLIDQYKDDAEEAEAERDELAIRVEELENDYQLLADNAKAIQVRMRQELVDENNQITIKAAAYLSIITEYEKVIDQYVGKTGTRLTTTQLTRLRKEQGL